MKISFPAMRGRIGQRTYYSCMMQLSVIPKMFTFRDWIEFRPEDREQRVLNQKRVPTIGKYIVDNEDGYIFSSITVSYKCEVKFIAHGDTDIGELEMNFEDANFVINDGQHRCAAIAHALTENPALGEETISVLLFEYENLERVQQMFSDLNRFVAKTSKSLDILYDKRDPISQATLRVSDIVPVFMGMVDKDAVSIGGRSTKLFSLAALYDANKELLRFLADDDEATVNDLVRVASEFWEVVSKAVPDWQKVRNQHMRAVELRQESICSHAVVLRALGAAGGELMKEYPNDWKSRISDLSAIDWRKSNADWEGICIIANSVVSNRQARAATKAYIKRRLGLTLTEGEERTVVRQKFSRVRPNAAGASSPRFEMRSPRFGLRATAIERDGEMVVLSGSHAAEVVQSSLTEKEQRSRELLIASGKLRKSDTAGLLEFSDDVAFSSPSAAACMVMGTSRNGRVDWKIEGSDKTYADWQASISSFSSLSGTPSGIDDFGSV